MNGEVIRLQFNAFIYFYLYISLFLYLIFLDVLVKSRLEGC